MTKQGITTEIHFSTCIASRFLLITKLKYSQARNQKISIKELIILSFSILFHNFSLKDNLQRLRTFPRHARFTFRSETYSFLIHQKTNDKELKKHLFLANIQCRLRYYVPGNKSTRSIFTKRFCSHSKFLIDWF